MDLCEKSDAKHMIRGLVRWLSLRGKIVKLRMDDGAHFENNQVANWLRR